MNPFALLFQHSRRMGLLGLACRYSVGRVLNYVAMLAIGFILTVSIVVTGVLDGMLEDMARRVRDLGEQVTVIMNRTPVPPHVFDAVKADLIDQGLVIDASPRMLGYGIAEGYAGREEPVRVEAIDLAAEVKHSNLKDHLKGDFGVGWEHDPTWRPRGYTGQRQGVFVGHKLAKRLGFGEWMERRGVGMEPPEIVIRYLRPGTGKMSQKRFILASTLHSGHVIKDQYAIIIPLSVAQEMFLPAGPDGAIDRRIPQMSLWLKDPDQAEARTGPIRERLLRALPPGTRFGVVSWQERYETMTESMRYENSLMAVVLTMMNAAGGFCIFAVLATLVSRRIRDVAVMRCLGATRFAMVLTFLLTGGIVGLFGAGLGVLGGVLVGSYLNEIFHALTGQKLYGPWMHGVDSGMPVVLIPWKVAAYSGGAVVIALLASLYPALWAGFREPLEALRDD